MLTFDALDQMREHSTKLLDSGWRPTPDMTGRAAQAFQKGLATNPLLRRYVDHLRQIPARNLLPWHALGERLYAMLCLTTCDGVGSRLLSSADMQAGGLPADQHARALGFAALAAGAQVYLWLEKVHELVNESPLPRFKISRDMLPYPVMFFSRETAHGMYTPGGAECGESNWTILHDMGDAVMCMGDVTLNLPGTSTPRGQADFVYGVIPYGTTYPDDFGHEGYRASAEQVLKMLAFISSPFVGNETHRLPRPMRKEMERAGLPSEMVEQSVHVVTLRREVAEACRRRDENAGSPDWKHHWWVSGHYRAQWYPSLNAHKVIWVAPHVKGPLEKPLLEKVYRVER